MKYNLSGIIRTFAQLSIIGFIINSCVKPVDLSLDSITKPVLVVDGQLTDLNLNNYVRLTWSRDAKNTSVVPVDSAVVIIASDDGDIDTLLNERLVETKYDDPLFEGYYYATKLQCRSGRTYHLTVDVDGNRYEADAFLPAVTQIDQVNLQYVEGYPINSHSYLPLLSFTEPKPEKNYYMTQICPKSSYTGELIKRVPCKFSDAIWNVAILDDEHLPAYVKDLDINVGATPSPVHKGWLWLGDYRAYLYSLTPEAYRHYQALIKSIESDGGVYSPTPANAPTNIKSKQPVAGFFNASGVSQYDFTV